jgi:TRAP-type transport system periplasmic protein
VKKVAIGLTALVTTTLAACGSESEAGTSEGGPEEVTLSFVTAFPEEHPLNDGFWMFVEELEERAPWVEVDYRGGPETMEAAVMIEGVSSGAVDGAYLPGDYYVAQVPALEIARFTPFTPSEEREAGVADLWGKVHEQAGLHYVGHASSGMPQVLLLTDEIDKPDLSGMSVRTSPATSNMVASLDGIPVDLPGTEIFTALERGVADGTAWTSVGVVALGFHDLVSYDLAPRFYESLANVVLNHESWESLDEATQDVITETMTDLEPKIFDHFANMAAEETAQWRAAGIELIEFEGDDAQQILEIAYRDAWDALDWDRISANGPEAEEIRSLFEAEYGEDLTEVVPGGAVVEPETDRFSENNAADASANRRELADVYWRSGYKNAPPRAHSGGVGPVGPFVEEGWRIAGTP